MLSEVFDLHLVTTDRSNLTDDINAHFAVFGTEYPNNELGEIAALREYLRRYDPAVTIAVIKLARYGTEVASLSRLYDIPFIHRYPANRFVAYKAASGWRTVGFYCYCNLFSRVPMYLADWHVVMGPNGKSQLADRGVDPSRISILPPSINQDRFDDRIQPVDLDIPTNRSVVLFVGRDSRMKGFEALRDAIPKVLESREDLQFVFVGTDRVPSVSKTYRSHLTAVGRVDPTEMPQYLKRADLLLHPSLAEGLPRVLGEAMFCRTVVLARDVGEVSSITSNTFSTDSEMVRRLIGFEELPLEDPTPFSCESLQPKYRELFGRFNGHT
jgi:glycosyltransferase involved in cell wall biosynthesis